MAKPRVTLKRYRDRDYPGQLTDWEKDNGHIKGMKIKGDVVQLPKGEYQIRTGITKMMIWKIDE